MVLKHIFKAEGIILIFNSRNLKHENHNFNSHLEPKTKFFSKKKKQKQKQNKKQRKNNKKNYSKSKQFHADVT